LNYERLLELSLCQAGIQHVYEQVSLIGGQIELCLPHGCCHLFCDGVSGNSSAVSFSGIAVQTNGPVTPMPGTEEFFTKIKTEVFPPVMCYFNPEKSVTSGQNFIDAHKERLKQLIYEAEKIAIIGVAVRTQDQHIWEPLRQSSAQLLYCSGKSGSESFNKWHLEKRRNADAINIPEYFEKAFDDICKFLEI
jgi:hypothetical protein